MENRLNKIEEKHIKELETKFGIKLPSEYIDFLINFDKAMPKNGIINLSNFDKETILPEDSAKIEFFSDLNNLSMALDDEFLRDEYILPIAFTYGDKMICIGFGKDNWGKIYYWNMDFDLVYLANSIYEFLSLIE